jgi:hypothetical protein
MRTPGEVLIGMFARINAGSFFGDEIAGAMLILLMRLRVLFNTNTVTEFQFANCQFLRKQSNSASGKRLRRPQGVSRWSSVSIRHYTLLHHN